MRKALFIVGIVSLLTGFSSCGNYEQDPPGEFDAEINAEEYVKNRLKSPSTAEFSNVDAKNKYGDKYKVLGSVDSQNGLGAMVRSTFSLELEFIDDGASYKVTEFVLQ